MKRILISFLLLLTVSFSSFAQPITIDEKDLEEIIRKGIEQAVTLAVDQAVEIVVKEYELKLVDKDIRITFVEAERDLAQASASRFEQLYMLEKQRNTNVLFKIIGIGVGGTALGLSTGYLLFK
jgi:hypothetical protein